MSAELTPSEHIAYRALCEAAASNCQCPDNIELEVLTGRSSCSQGSKLVRRLEEKGMIQVRRYQRFREVLIIATGEWTARSPSRRTERPHVPKGNASRGPAPSAGRIAKKQRNS